MWFDAAFGVLLVIGAFRGYRQGFAFQTVQFTGLILSVVLAEPASKLLLPHLGNKLGSLPESLHGPVLFMASMAVICLAVWISGVIYLSWYRKRAFGEDKPSLGDRILGVGVGAVKFGLVVCVLAFIVSRLPTRTMELFPAVKGQYDDSKFIRVAVEFQPVERLLSTPEIRRVRENLGLLVQYYRSSEEGSSEEGSGDEASKAATDQASVSDRNLQ